MTEWNPISTAPMDGSVIEVCTRGGKRFPAYWGGGLMDSNDQECGGWHAAFGDLAPDCWTDGVCWHFNEAGQPSDPPIKWRYASTHNAAGAPYDNEPEGAA